MSPDQHGRHVDELAHDEGGFRERREFPQLSRSIRGRRSARFISEAGTLCTGRWRSRMGRAIEDRERRFPDWGFKDPRTALVYSLWAAELPRSLDPPGLQPPLEVR